MNPNSSASKILQLKKIELIAPSFIKSELEKYKQECLQKSGLSEQEFKTRLTNIYSKISFLDFKDYKRFLKKALQSVPDPDDSAYIALSMKTNIPIWSNDSHLKQQSLVKVYTTKDLINELLTAD